MGWFNNFLVFMAEPVSQPNKIRKNDLRPADHIYAPRFGHVYSHHGIYMGGDKVMHFTSASKLGSLGGSSNPCPYCGTSSESEGVVLSCLDCFLKDAPLRRHKYGTLPEGSVSDKDRWGLRGKQTASVWDVQSGVRGTSAPADTVEMTLYRAQYLYESEAGFGEYDLVANNWSILLCTARRSTWLRASCSGRRTPGFSARPRTYRSW
ncbi:unnamed protein product [Calypogeia fissa]